MVLVLLNAIFVFLVFTGRIQYSLHTHLCHTTAYRHYNNNQRRKIQTYQQQVGSVRKIQAWARAHGRNTSLFWTLIIPGRRNTKIPKIRAACSSAVARIAAAETGLKISAISHD
jgi:GH15 family glucan-1,4-alpha-glucosidase